jgi:hypothetical protein
MKIKVVVLMLVVLLGCGGIGRATDIDVYSSGTIQPNDLYDTVNVWNSANLVMTGGSVTTMNDWNSSITNIYGGNIGNLWMFDSSIVNLYGGTFGKLYYTSDLGVLNIYGYNLTNQSNVISGNWSNGQAFSFPISIRAYSPQIELHQIPEPISLLFLSAGLLRVLTRRTN